MAFLLLQYNIYIYIYKCHQRHITCYVLLKRHSKLKSYIVTINNTAAVQLKVRLLTHPPIPALHLSQPPGITVFEKRS